MRQVAGGWVWVRGEEDGLYFKHTVWAHLEGEDGVCVFCLELAHHFGGREPPLVRRREGAAGGRGVRGGRGRGEGARMEGETGGRFRERSGGGVCTRQGLARSSLGAI